MEDSRHYKASLEEAMATLMMSGVCKIRLERTSLLKEECSYKKVETQSV